MDSKAKIVEDAGLPLDIGLLISRFSGDIVAVLDRESHPIWISDSTEKLLGYSPEEVIELRQYGESLLHPEDIITVKSSFDQFLKEPGHQVITYRVKHKDGHWVWVEQTRDPICDSSDRVDYVLTIGRLVETPRAGDATLKEFEDRFREVFNQMPTACLCYDHQGRVLMLNSEAEKMYGFKVEEVVGKHVWETIAPAKERETSLRVISEVFWGRSYRGIEWSDRRKDGSKIEVVSNLFPIFGPDGSVQMCLSSNTDISPLKATEEALRLSEEKYRILIENIQDGAFLIQDKKLLFVNQAFAKTVGCSVHEIIGKEFFQYIHPDDVEFVQTRHAARMKMEEVPSDYEFRALKSDKETVVYVNMNVGLIPYGDGYAAIGTIKDITEKKKAEKELRDSEERFRRLSEASQEGIIVHEAGRILDVNKRFAEMTGIDQTSLLGTLAYDLATPESRELMMKNMLASFDDPFEVEMKTVSGENITVEIKGKLFPFKERIVRIASVRDVSSYRKVISDLEKSESRFRLVADNLGEGLLITDIDSYEIVFVNDKLCELTGYGSADLIGKPVYEMLLFEDDWQKLTDRNKERKQGLSETYESSLRKKDGKGFWTQITASPFRDVQGVIIGTLAVVKDITARRQSESALKESEEKFRNLSEEIADGVAIIIDSVLNWVNKAFCTVFGYTRDELVGKRFEDLIIEGDKAKAISAIQARLLHSPVGDTAEFHGFRKDGKDIYIDFSARRMQIENHTAVLIVVRDITERRLAVEALSRNEEQYRALVESTNAVPWELNLDTQKFTYMGPQVANVLGYTHALWTNFDFWKSIVHPKDLVVAEKFRLSAESGTEQKELEYRMFRADGSTIWVRDIISPVVVEKNIHTLRGLLLNINEYKKAELLQTALLGISEQSTGISKIRDLIQVIHENLAVVMDVSNFFIARYNSETSSYEIPYFADQYDDLTEIQQCEWKHGMTELVRKSGKPMFIDLKKLAKLKKEGEIELVGSPPLLWLGVPIKTESETIGVLAVQTYTDEFLYREEDLDLLIIIAGHVEQVILKTLALEELERSERKFRALADNVPGAIYICQYDERHTMAYLNDKIEELTGINKDEFISNRVSLTELIHPDDLERVQSSINDGVANRQVYHLVYRLIHTCGKYLWVEEFGTGVFKEDELIHLEGFIVDVTTRKEAQDALQESREWLSTTLRSIGDAVIATDNEAKVIFMNPVAESLTGYSIGEVRGKSIFDVFNIVNETTGKPADNPVNRIINEGIVIGLANSTALITKEGMSVPIDDSGAPIKDEKGNVIGTVLVFHDVTEKRRSREALRQSEERFRTMTDTVDAYLWSAEVLGAIEKGEYEYKLYTNGVERITGVKAEIFINEKDAWLKLVHKDDMSVMGDAWARLFKGNKTTEAYRIIRPDGEIRWVQDSCTPTLDNNGRLIRLDGVCVDITERMAISEALKESEGRYRQLVENLKSGVYVIQNGKYVYVNPAMSEIFGYSTDELLAGMSPIDLTMPEYVEIVKDNITKRLNGEIDTLFYATKGRHRGGSSIDVEVWSGTVEYKGKPAILGTLRDITEIKLIEESLRKAHRLDAMGSLSADFAHYFNNVLTSITGNCELLLDKTASEEEKEQIVDIQSAAKNATGVLSDLLSFSRKQELKIETIEPTTVLGETLRFLKQLLPENIIVNEEFGPDIEPIIADSDQLQQCIINLVLNSKEAMPNGGTINFRISNRKLSEKDNSWIKVVKPGAYILIEITDTGCGIPDEYLEKVMMPFFTTKGKEKNAGLGLAMIYGYVNQINGQIAIDSVEGKGTSVRLVFPSAGPKDKKGEYTANDVSYCGTETVLLVEDDRPVRDLARRSLKKFGYNVVSAKNGLEALKLIENENIHVDIVVSDVVMPEMGGMKLEQRLRESLPDIPVIFISGYSTESLRRDGIVIDESSLTLKPFSPQELCKAVRHALDSRK